MFTLQNTICQLSHKTCLEDGRNLWGRRTCAHIVTPLSLLLFFSVSLLYLGERLIHCMIYVCNCAVNADARGPSVDLLKWLPNYRCDPESEVLLSFPNDARLSNASRETAVLRAVNGCSITHCAMLHMKLRCNIRRETETTLLNGYMLWKTCLRNWFSLFTDRNKMDYHFSLTEYL